LHDLISTKVLKSISEIIEYTRPSGLCIGLENRYRYYDIPIIEEMDELMNLCEENWFGFQYDSGHAQTLGALGICEHEEWLKRFGKRIIGTHLHDVQGIMDHQQPGVGDVDFEMIARYLPATAYRRSKLHLN
jgi:sugar phosphate isomerase/epimerase